MNPVPPEFSSRTAADPVDGLLLVDKPAGLTSHDVVDRIRRRFRFRKVGHGGTLDPMATGLLVILLGRGTRLSERITATDKIYEGTVHLGVRTDTEDVDGRVISECDASAVGEDAVRAAMARRTGDLLQTPPMLSAVKKGGVPLYRLARKGQVVEREPKLIHVYEFTLLGFKPPRVHFRLRCTKGTYVRTLCAEVGEELGCGAFLESLRRIAVGDFRIESAVPLDTVLQWDLDQLRQTAIPLSRVPVF